MKILKNLLRCPLAREGVTPPGGYACLHNSRQTFRNIVGLTALQLALIDEMRKHWLLQKEGKKMYTSSIRRGGDFYIEDGLEGY